jgi:tetratricopeptide (TPR) repeat protein
VSPLNEDTGALVQRLQSQLAVDPKDTHSWALLGLAYQQRARETGDPTYYSKSAGALGHAVGDPLVDEGLGSLALSRHRFGEALAFGRKAHAETPGSADPYGVIGDALVELGRYREAFHAFDTMNRLRPSLASYARVSYGRELRGDTRGALRALRLAVDAATATREPAAWTRVQLGKLYFAHGRYADALREERTALAIFPGYPYGLDAAAQAEAALGHRARAIALERRAHAAIPQPPYVAQHGDLIPAAGRPRAAARQYRLIGAIDRLLRANGVRTDLEIALFRADYGQDAVARARLAQRLRPSIDGDDVLAWALARQGRCGEALGGSQRSLRLGTRDALKFFHRGWIERCLGRPATARAWMRRALALNPGFSVRWSPVARRLS